MAAAARATSVRELINSAVLSSQPKKNADCFASQRFQVVGGEIFFAELDVVDTLTGGFCDFVE
ncbi:MAG: hypothetical protein WBE23_00095 [Candidatus Sulfotelmatobacter sp.]